MQRRHLMAGAAAAAIGRVLAPRPIVAQTRYPSRTITLIVPSPAGGVYDLNGRLLADVIRPKLGTIVIDNRSGGTAWIGVLAAAKGRPTATPSCSPAAPPTFSSPR